MLKDKFLRAGTLLFVTSMVTNIFNYIFQLTMGRLLSTEDFGLMNALFSLLMITVLPFMTITMVLAKYASNFTVEGSSGRLKGLFIRSYKNIFLIGLLLLLAFVSLSSLIKDFLNMASIVPVVLIGVAIFTSLPLPINTAFLQGLQKFLPLGLVSGLLGPVKFVCCLILVVLGLRVNGVLWGLILANIAIFVISYAPLRPMIRSASAAILKLDALFRYAVPVFMANLCFAVLAHADLIMVRHYFSAPEVGLYSSAAVLGKAIMYLPTSLVLALFPMVAEAQVKAQDPMHLLLKALTYTIVLSGLGVLGYMMFPNFIMNLLFGQRYVDAASILGLYGLAMLPMGLLLIIMNYNLARNSAKFVKYLAVFTCFQIFLIVLIHQTLDQILWIMLGCGGMAVLTILFAFTLETRLTSRKLCNLLK